MDMNLQKMMKQAQELQRKMAEQQEQLAEKTYEATAGGGMVTVEVNGKAEVLRVKLDPDVFAGGDKEMIEDLIVAGVNEALKQAQEAQQAGMMGVMGNMGLKIPGLF